MNRHFRRDADGDTVIPSTVFARLDHVVTPGAMSQTVLLAFDAVDADWIARQGRHDPLFNLDDPDKLIAAWLLRGPPLPGATQSPFEQAPLYRIEVEIPLGTTPFGYPGAQDFEDTGSFATGLAALEGAWFRFEVFQQGIGASPALIYPSLFAQPIPVFVKGTMPTPQQGKALSGIFSLASLPTVSTSGFAQMVSSAHADYLAAYDVGQGNANALLKVTDPDPARLLAAPTLYFDLGGGIYRNKHTTPQPLVFCFSLHPIIILSHWDADHWAGAYATSVSGHYPALTQTWVAPLQAPGPLHIAFAYDLVAQGGTMYTYSPAPGTVGAVILGSGHTLRFTTGSGTCRNHSGIVVAVENTSLVPARSWLLTGDCDYRHFVSTLAPLDPVAIVVPHHGADLHHTSVAPVPVAAGHYRRLVYSYGAGNLHGATNVQHPTSSGVTAHANSGWWHGAWSMASPGSVVAGGDVLETGIHGVSGIGTFNRGGSLVDWEVLPPSIGAPCQHQCTISPIRS